MAYLIAPDPALEELRRQLRENEITMFAYKKAAAGLVEPSPPNCARGCGREASRIESGVPVCEVCATVARRRRS
jgi:hypothetical protein